MKLASRAGRLLVQIPLVLALLGVGTFSMLRPYLSDDEDLYKQGRIDEVVSQGPVTVQSIEWKLDSMKAYTALLNEDGEAIKLDAPAGSIVVLATLTVTPRKGIRLNEQGFSCDALLRDSKGNTWDDTQAYGYPLPTYCGDDDHPFTMDKPGQVAKVYIVPKSAVPNLIGLTVEDFYIHRRVLITP
ncbi:hypothetical protein [Kribbella sindirgiensis]|uniref:DUF4352 domain-containing protein n=1 Tax=Kribbella sindirgiensis TaxID=1124744 RepID=A0A4R0JB50_9ACTN|nr:hypothetical protein [Kribbella sindirgiensis]TCC43489.1 hypothetical protein E0H50_03235 [Kribbella sindirgiensis]